MEDWGSSASKGLKQQTERTQKDGDNIKGESKLQAHCLHGQGFYLSFVYSQCVCWARHSLWSWLLALRDDSNHQHTALVYTWWRGRESKWHMEWHNNRGWHAKNKHQRTNNVTIRPSEHTSPMSEIEELRLSLLFLECMWELYGGFSPLQI